MFTEKTHAYIIGSYYKHLLNRCGMRGVEIFVKATQRCAEQRGNRMALRAMRDGHKLDYAAYMAYGEWTATFKAEARDVGENGEKRTNIYSCAWAETFKEMGLTQCGTVYCNEIDRGIVRGFNPDLQFKTHQTLNDSPYCDLHFIGSNKNTVLPEPKDSKRDWLYHCAHVMKTFGDVCMQTLGDAEVMGEVQEDFVAKYSEDSLILMIEEMVKDFNRI